MESTKPIFICDFNKCEKIFTTKYSLVRHMSTHLKKKAFKCKECDKTFSIKQNLIEHEFVHTGELPYVWNFNGCAERFRQRGKLSLHRQTHKNYKKKSYRSHTHMNEEESWARPSVGHSSGPVNSSTVSNQTVPNVQVMQGFGNSQNMYLLNNQCGKINQVNLQQNPYLTISKYFFQPSMAPMGIIQNQVMPQYPTSASLPKLSVVMMPSRMNSQFNN